MDINLSLEDISEEMGEVDSCNASCECLVCKTLQESLSERRVRSPLWARKELRESLEEAERLRQWVLRQRLRPCACRRAFSFLHAHSCRRLGVSAHLRAAIRRDLLRLEEHFLKAQLQPRFE